MLKPNLKCDSNRRWVFLGKWFFGGITVLIKEIPESCPSTLPSPREKRAICEPGNSSSPDSALILASTSRTMRNKLLCKPPRLWYFYYSSPNRLKHQARKRNKGERGRKKKREGGRKEEKKSIYIGNEEINY